MKKSLKNRSVTDSASQKKKKKLIAYFGNEQCVKDLPVCTV